MPEPGELDHETRPFGVLRPAHFFLLSLGAPKRRLGAVLLLLILFFFVGGDPDQVCASQTRPSPSKGPSTGIDPLAEQRSKLWHWFQGFEAYGVIPKT